MDNKEFYFGMNLHNKGYDAYPERSYSQYLEICKNMHMDMIRFNYCPQTEQDFLYLEDAIEKCHALEMKFMLVTDQNLDMDLSELEYETYYSSLSARLGNKVDIYQVFNELDVYAMHTDIHEIYNAGDGKVKEEYFPKRLAKTAPAVRGAIKGIREKCPDAKICVNFSWWHTYFIEYLHEQGCDWDITGCDWYSDAEKSSSIIDLFNWLTDKFPEREIIICETNWWANGEPKDEVSRDELQAKWNPEFANTVYNCNIPNVKGIIYYELMDELSFEEDHGGYNGESHFGFVKCNRFGDDRSLKPTCETLKNQIVNLRK